MEVGIPLGSTFLASVAKSEIPHPVVVSAMEASDIPISLEFFSVVIIFTIRYDFKFHLSKNVIFLNV